MHVSAVLKMHFQGAGKGKVIKFQKEVKQNANI